MLCKRAEELFSDYCEGSLQPALTVSLEGHLNVCEECRAQVEGLRRVWRVLDAAPIVEPPTDFRTTVWQRIEAGEQRHKEAARRPRLTFDWRQLFTRPALGWAAAVLLVIVLAGYVVPGRYTTAGNWFPWSLLYGRKATSLNIPAGNPIRRLTLRPTEDGTKPTPFKLSAGEPYIEFSNGQGWLIVPLFSDSSVTVNVEASAESDLASAVGSAPNVALRKGELVNVPLRLRWNIASVHRTLVLNVGRADQPSERQSVTITVPNGYTIGEPVHPIR